jgi:hypothetical protein
MTKACRKAFADQAKATCTPEKLARAVAEFGREATASKEAARAALRSAGIIDRSGKLTPAYR